MASNGVVASATVVLLLMVHVVPFAQGRAHVHMKNMGSIDGVGIINDRVLMNSVSKALANNRANTTMDGYKAPFNITIGMTCNLLCDNIQQCNFQCHVHR